MKVALLEMRRTPSRFAASTGALTVLTLLLLFLGALLDGLFGNATGAIRSQPDGVIIVSGSATTSLLRSTATEADVDTVASDPDVADAGGLGLTLTGMRRDGDDEIFDAAIIGYELAGDQLDSPPPPGRARVDSGLRDSGVSIGDTLVVGAAGDGADLVVDGFVDDANFLGQSGVWVDLATWREMTRASRPDRALGDDEINVIVAQPRRGVTPTQLSAHLDDGLTDAATPLFASTRQATVEALPGVREQNATFSALIGVTLFVVGLVVALFFALLTLERVGLYAVFKAFGASSASLMVGVVTQALVVALVAFAVGVAAALLLSVALPAGVPVAFTLSRALMTGAGLATTAVAGSLLSLRRVAAVDPASAIGAGL